MRYIPLSGRLPQPTREDLRGPARDIYDAILAARLPAGSGGSPTDSAGPATVVDAEGRLLGPFNAMVHASPEIGGALQNLGSAIRYRGILPDRVRELAILIVAAARESEFEWFAHVRAGVAAGLTDDMLESVARGDPGVLTPDDAVLHRAVTELLAGDLSEQSWLDATELLGVPAVVDLVILVGYYGTLATMLRAFRVPRPE